MVLGTLSASLLGIMSAGKPKIIRAGTGVIEADAGTIRVGQDF